mmetsp:Transcript_9265/g.13861  ORF Transcript_9265/g.13861 Transcript_9265/m.13861 type:complete len:127 (-) Transcript_9265:451-831(-)|eukprot:CAMPEP_0194094526 /NCGR_PEP_ID=MMETSP0149-20130528/54449_1 /TAXON_ID=122233 /ORGANISM="Chaetoceros debilis, Strain MM31A-1" /LENGTH=126 /DNA_ID=CAMNT_0038780215 /DNA_START=55 /DNA_END=435 /DNA_ORIENTATION=+
MRAVTAIILTVLSNLSVFSDALVSSNARQSAQINRQRNKMKAKRKRTNVEEFEQSKKLKCEVCPEQDLDLDMDRREASFALLGQILAAGVGTSALLSPPAPVEAVYGADANIEMPNVVEGINKRVN